MYSQGVHKSEMTFGDKSHDLTKRNFVFEIIRIKVNVNRCTVTSIKRIFTNVFKVQVETKHVCKYHGYIKWKNSQKSNLRMNEPFNIYSTADLILRKLYRLMSIPPFFFFWKKFIPQSFISVKYLFLHA